MIFLWIEMVWVFEISTEWNKAAVRTALSTFTSVCPSLARPIKTESFPHKQLFLDFRVIQSGDYQEDRPEAIPFRQR